MVVGCLSSLQMLRRNICLQVKTRICVAFLLNLSLWLAVGLPFLHFYLCNCARSDELFIFICATVVGHVFALEL